MNCHRWVITCILFSLACFSSASVGVSDGLRNRFERKNTIVDEVKSNPEKYLFAEGEGNSFAEADNEALSRVSSQVYVEISTLFNKTANIRDSHVNVSAESRVKSYSEVQLSMCRQVIIENGPKKYKVLRYILREDISKQFASREKKAKGMVGIARRAKEDGKLDVALRYYYWAKMLISSTARPSEVFFTTEDGIQAQAESYLNSEISGILSSVRFNFAGFDSDNKSVGRVFVTYGGKPVTSLDFTYFDGNEWTVAPTEVKDGNALVEFPTNSATKEISVRIIYSYDSNGYVKSDREVASVLRLLPQVNYPEASISGIKLNRKAVAEANKEEALVKVKAEEATQAMNAMEVNDKSVYLKSFDVLKKAIQTRNYDECSDFFTPNGLEVYKRLIKYGNAMVINTDNTPKIIEFDGAVYIRSLPVQFRFKSNFKTFAENVVLTLSKDGKIDNLSFALDAVTLDSVLQKTSWGDMQKIAIINFLENYKTAFALERLDYIGSMFSDKAIIIVGKVLKDSPKTDDITLSLNSREKIVYNRYNKQQYLSNLRACFDNNEYVNLKFSNLSISKVARDREQYCIQIKQDYFSSNYGDSGYLFLLMNAKDYRNPIIQIRTWQPQPDSRWGSSDGIFGLGDITNELISDFSN